MSISHHLDKSLKKWWHVRQYIIVSLINCVLTACTYTPQLCSAGGCAAGAVVTITVKNVNDNAPLISSLDSTLFVDEGPFSMTFYFFQLFAHQTRN